MSDSEGSLGFEGSDAEDMDFEQSYAPDEEDIMKKVSFYQSLSYFSHRGVLVNIHYFRF